MNAEEIGKFIAGLRKNKKLTQNQIADYVGVSAKSVSKWETGVGIPDIMYLQKLCEILEIEIDELLSAQINQSKRKKQNYNKLINLILKVFSFFAIPLLVFLLYFFIHEFHSFHNYSISVDYSNTFSLIKGNAITKNNRSYISLTISQIDNYYIKYDDVISVDIYDNDNLIYHSNENTFNFQIDESIENKQLKIILKLEFKNIEETFKLAFKEEKLIKDSEKYHNNNDLGVPSYQKLIDYGFKDIGNNTMSASEDNKTIMYNLSSRELSITLTNKSSTSTIIYNVDLQTLENATYENYQKERVLLEKYVYYYFNKELSCQVGTCSSFRSVLEIMDPYLNLLYGEY